MQLNARRRERHRYRSRRRSSPLGRQGCHAHACSRQRQVRLGGRPSQLECGLEDEVVATQTFVVRQNALGNFHGAARSDIAGGGLEEDDGLLRDGVVQLLGMLAVVPADGHNLVRHVISVHARRGPAIYLGITFLPCCTNEAATLVRAVEVELKDLWGKLVAKRVKPDAFALFRNVAANISLTTGGTRITVLLGLRWAD